jgi:hypothetical protein
VTVYLVVFLLLSIPTAHALLINVDFDAGAELEATDDGPTVYFDEDRQLADANDVDTFPASDSVHVEVQEGAAFYNGSADTRAEIETINGTWSNVTNADVTAGNLTINPEGMQPASVKGDATDFGFKGEATVNDGIADAEYGGPSGTATITLETDGTAGTQYGLVDNDTETTLSVDVAGTNGQVVFTDAPMSDHTVRVEELGDLTVREETPGHPKITGATLSVKFFEDSPDDPVIINRTDSDNDGVIDLTGLPVDEEFVAKLKAPGYHQRTVIIEDLSQQETAFMLSDSGTPTTLEQEFVVDDTTGEFDGESTEIIIQRAINKTTYSGSGGYEYLNVAGDDVGADGTFITDLQEDIRYRIIVRNDDGDVRQLGAYTPKVAGQVPLEIGEITAQQTNVSDIAWSANISESGGSDTFEFRYNDTRDATDRLYLKAYERGNESNVLVANQSFSGPLGSVAVSEPVPAGENDTEWVVEVRGRRSGSEDFVADEPLSTGTVLLPSLPGWLTALMSIGMIWVVAGLFSQLNGDIGALVVAGMGAMFWWVGFVPDALGVGVVILSMITAGLVFINERNDGGL